MADNQNSRPEVDESWLRSQKVKSEVDSQCFATWSLIKAKQREELQKAYESQPWTARINPYSSQYIQNKLMADKDSWANKGPEYFMQEVVTALQKKGIPIDAVVEKHIIDYLVEKDVPRNRAEHFFTNLVRELDPSSVARTPMEAYVREEAERKFNPKGEVVTPENAAMEAVTWNPLMLIPELTTKVNAMLSGNTSDKFLVQQAQQALEDVKAAESQKVNIPKWMLSDIGLKRISDASGQQLESAFIWAQANAAAYSKSVDEAVRNGQRTISIAKAPVTVEAASNSGAGTASSAVSSPHASQATDGEMISVYDATLRFKQYVAFMNALDTEYNKRHQASMFQASVSGIKDEQERQQTLNQTVDFFQKTGFVLKMKDGHPYYPGFINLAGTQAETLPDNLEVGMFLDASKSSLKALPSGLKVNESLYLAGSAVTALPENLVVEGDLDLKDTRITEIPETIKVKGDIYLPDGTKITATQEQRTQDGYVDLAKSGVTTTLASIYDQSVAPASEQDPSKGKGDSPKQDTPQYSGWDQLAGALGLSGMGDTMSNAGLTIANLPNLLLGMFNGKSSFGMNAGTLLPLAAILFGSTVKNPLLKWSLIALGAGSLFNKAGQETLSKYRGETSQQSQPEVVGRFRQYADEALNPRITRPEINEYNQLVMNIDRIPRVINVSPSLIEAYNAGALPINTLANHVLDKVEQQQQIALEAQLAASQRYEQAQDREQGRGIR